MSAVLPAAPDVTSVAEAITRMKAIEAALPAEDGLACFNRLYLDVTSQVYGELGQGFYLDPAFMAQLDVAFANLYFPVVDLAADPAVVPLAWRPLVERRDVAGIEPIQFALAGMNAHINHDLPLAVVRTCAALATSPEDSQHLADYQKVDKLLDAAEQSLRQSFETAAELAVDRHVSAVATLICNWTINSARDLAWNNAQLLWAVRSDPLARGLFLDSLAASTALATRMLLVAVLRVAAGRAFRLVPQPLHPNPVVAAPTGTRPQPRAADAARRPSAPVSGAGNWPIAVDCWQTWLMAQVLCPVLIGRDAELEAVDAALTAAMAGRGGCVVITGEPGIGKSRLAREATSRAASHGIRVVTGRSVPQSATAAYRPLTDALVQLLRDRAVPDDEAMEPWLSALSALLPGMTSSTPATATATPSIRGEALIQLLRRLTPQGLVIVLEDLHWADPDTMALMEYLGEHLDGESLLCVLTLRADRPSAALDVTRRQRGRPGIRHLDLDRLSDDDMARMVRACVPGAEPELLRRVQSSAEGVPLLVEDLLASPGLPESFTETVRERLAGFSDQQREVIEAAAIFGRHFDWELLPAVSGQTAAVVTETLRLAVERLLVSADGSGFSFRHALTREAVLDTLLPPRQRALASKALAVLDAEHQGSAPELAAELANRAGDRRRAGALLSESGRQALAWGALATATDTLRRAADLLEGNPEREQAELLLVEALALAGRVEEAAAAGGQLITRLGTEAAELRVEVHLRLGQAAVAASRWQMARHHLGAARRLAGTAPSAGVRARMSVIEAEVAFAADDLDGARRIAEGVLAAEGGAPEVRCHAFELIGRTYRLRELSAARAAFESALVTAEAADLPLWRLRALHELGTIDLLDHAGVERLSQARRAAEQMGALSTVAILDLQLAAAFTCRWELGTCDAHARAAVDLAERLGLDQVRAKALAVLTGSASMRADAGRTEHYAARAIAAAPDDQMVEGVCWASRGALALLGGDAAAAVEPYARGMAILARLPHAEPVGLRGLWPLLLASLGDSRAPRAIEEARRLGVGAIRHNRSLIGYAEAVLAGRAGRRQRANELAAGCDVGFANGEAWGVLARFCAAPAALADGWGDPLRWLAEAEAGFDRLDLTRLAERCRELLKESQPNPWVAAGITDREADVLRLVADGLANKEIAARLRLSPRTVEKHVESLLRKTGARSRTGLAAASQAASQAAADATT